VLRSSLISARLPLTRFLPRDFPGRIQPCYPLVRFRSAFQYMCDRVHCRAEAAPDRVQPQSRWQLGYEGSSRTHASRGLASRLRMGTIQGHVTYRPLRIGWCVRSSSLEQVVDAHPLPDRPRSAYSRGLREALQPIGPLVFRRTVPPSQRCHTHPGCVRLTALAAACRKRVLEGSRASQWVKYGKRSIKEGAFHSSFRGAARCQ